MHRVASAVVRDCPIVPQSVRDIASFATNQKGKSRRTDSLERSLHRWVRRQPWGHVLPKSYDFKVSIKSRSRIGSALGRASVLLPHEMFGTLYKYPELFEHLLSGTKAELKHWWDMSMNTDWADRHKQTGRGAQSK